MGDVVRELRRKKEQVEHILRNYPNSRDNDFYLVILWLKLFGGLSDYIGYIPYELIRELSGVMTLRRMRQKIQNDDGKYLPSDPVRLARRDRARNIRRGIGRI